MQISNNIEGDTLINFISLKLSSVSSKHAEYFLEIIDSLSSQPDIDGVLLGGSLSRGKADLYSDIDLFCLCNSGKVELIKTNLTENFQRLENIEQVIEQDSFGWLGETISLFYANELFFSVDIGLLDFSKSKHFFWEPTGIILWDNHKAIARGQNSVRAYAGYQRFPFSSQFPVRSSVILLKKLRKNLLRNHLWNCIEYLNKLRRNLIFLIRIHLAKQDNFLGNPERDIEDVLPSEMLERLSKTQPKLNKFQIAEAVFLLTDWLVTIVDRPMIEFETKGGLMTTWLLKELRDSREWFLDFFETLEKS